MTQTQSTWNRLAPWIVAAAGAALLLLLADSAFGQVGGEIATADVRGDSLQWRGETETRLEVWTGSKNCYQNAYDFIGETSLRWGPLSATGYADWRLWSSCDGIAEGSPLNAETNKVFATGYGGYLLVHLGPFGIGPQIHRHEVHHVWPNAPDWRGDYFPHDNSWRAAEARCEREGEAEKVKPYSEGPCPAVGYRERIGIRAAYLPSWGEIAVYAAIWQPKELTLRPHLGALTADITPTDKWRIQATARLDVEREIWGTVHLQRQIAGPLMLGITAFHRQPPGWRNDPINMVAATIALR